MLQFLFIASIQAIATIPISATWSSAVTYLTPLATTICYESKGTVHVDRVDSLSLGFRYSQGRLQLCGADHIQPLTEVTLGPVESTPQSTMDAPDGWPLRQVWQ